MRILRVMAIALVAVSAGSATSGSTQQVAAGTYRIIRDRGRSDTLNKGVVNANAVVVQTDPTASENYGPGGEFRIVWASDPFGLKGGTYFRLMSSEALQPIVDSTLEARPSATIGSTDESLRTIPNFPGGSAVGRPLIAAKVPFLLYDSRGVVARVVMFQRHDSGDAPDSVGRNTRLFGIGDDTVRVAVPPDVWLPGDTLYVVSGQGVNQFISLKLTLGCAPPRDEPQRITCNPIALGTKGATGYLPLSPGYESVWRVQAAAAGGSGRDR